MILQLLLFCVTPKKHPSCAVITHLICLVQNNLGCWSLKVYVWLKPSTLCGSIALAELDVCKLPKEFVSLQNTAGKFELISFPTNLRLISLQLSESSRTSSSASHTLSALLRGSGISQEHLKGEEGYCYFVFFPHQEQR